MFFGHNGLDYNQSYDKYIEQWEIVEKENNKKVFKGMENFITLYPYIRVYEIAKMFGLGSKECLKVLGDLAVHHFNYVDPHMSTYLLRRHVGDLIGTV